MRGILVLVFLGVVTGELDNNLAAQQILNFKKKSGGPIGIMTTSAGAPIEYKEARISLNTPVLFNEYLVDSLTHLVRERIPERVVHAKAGGGFGYFEVTNDITDICKAKLFSNIGKKTPIVARFSPVVVNMGGIDTSRDARGFAVKFYTEDGNLDLLGLTTPNFAIRDPLLFTAFARAQKRNPATSLIDPSMLWDFLTSNPESLFMFMLIFADRGIPASYASMPGFMIHTFQVYNELGESYFVRFHFLPKFGIKSLRSEDARRIAANDPDYLNRDLYNLIENGKFPEWEVSVQVLTLDDVKKADIDVFDVTKVLPQDKYPLRLLGRMVLNKNPTNYFAEIEQLAMNPANLVPGILGGADKLFEARRLAYRDAQYYRLGANFNKIPVNCPIQAKVLAYNRDGVAPVDDNFQDIPNYYPNSFNGPIPYIDKLKPAVVNIVENEPHNFDQATELYINEMDREERGRLIENLVASISRAAPFLQERATKLFTLIHPDIGRQLEIGLAVNKTSPIVVPQDRQLHSHSSGRARSNIYYDEDEDYE